MCALIEPWQSENTKLQVSQSGEHIPFNLFPFYFVTTYASISKKYAQ